jgi:hemoglobin/transferrin/lactoferrin receptor protein
MAPASPSAAAVGHRRHQCRGRAEKSSDFPDPTINTYSLFAQDQISWNKWTFLPGLRYDYTELKPHITGNSSTPWRPTARHRQRREQDLAPVSPKFGLTYALTDNYTWYGQYAEGFRTPTAKRCTGALKTPPATA